MPTDIVERLEQPEYTGENRCTPCTVANLLIAAGLAVLAGRRNRALGILVFLGSAALIYLRGYLVPGTPELTKRYLPEEVLAAFGKADRPDSVPDEVARHAADRAERADAAGEPAANGAGAAVEAAADADAGTDEAAADAEPDADADADEGGEPDVRADAEELLEEPMDVILQSLGAVVPEGHDLAFEESFREAWLAAADELEGEELDVAFADLFGESLADVEVEERDDGRFYGLVDGLAQHNWMSETALRADLAAGRVIAERDDRWAAFDPEERTATLKGLRAFMETCPSCGGDVVPTDEVVESCCGSWDVVAVRCTDCEERVLEVMPPEDDDGGGAATAGTPGGFSR